VVTQRTAVLRDHPSTVEPVKPVGPQKSGRVNRVVVLKGFFK